MMKLRLKVNVNSCRDESSSELFRFRVWRRIGNLLLAVSLRWSISNNKSSRITSNIFRHIYFSFRKNSKVEKIRRDVLVVHC